MINNDISFSDLSSNFIVETKALGLRVIIMLKVTVTFQHQYIMMCVMFKVGGCFVQINFKFKISCRLFVLQFNVQF
jgi:hypothetical protein